MLISLKKKEKKGTNNKNLAYFITFVCDLHFAVLTSELLKTTNTLYNCDIWNCFCIYTSLQAVFYIVDKLFIKHLMN